MAFESIINDIKTVNREFVMTTVTARGEGVPMFSLNGTIDGLLQTTATTTDNSALTTVGWVLSNVGTVLVADYSLGDDVSISAADSITSAFGKTQGQIDSLKLSLGSVASVSKGGTGLTTIKKNSLIIGNDADEVTILEPTAAGVLQFDGVAWDIKANEGNIINVAKEGGDFSSVKEAIDSITDATSTNKYVIKVGVGIFVEDTITLKPFVNITGTDYTTTILEVDDPNKDLIIGTGNSSIFNCQLKGSTGVGKSLVVYNGGGLFRLDSVRFGTSYHYVKVGSSVATSIVHVTRCSAEPNTKANTCFVVSDNGTNPVQILIEYFVQSTLGTNEFTNFLDISGIKTTAGLNSVSNVKMGGTGYGILIYNAANLRVAACTFQGFDTSIKVDNVGAAPTINIMATASNLATSYDIYLDHPQTQGSIGGNYTKDKVYISDTITNLSLLYTDPSKQGTVTLGDFYIGKTSSSLVDIYPILTSSPTMGVYQGGEITASGIPFQVTISGGFGYVNTTYPNQQLTKIVWDTQTVMLSPNTARYLYFNSSGILTQGASQPSTKTNILLGRVISYTDDIELIDNASKMVGQHTANNIDQLTRSAIGAIYETGSKVTANNNREISVTAGSYYFGGNKITTLQTTAPTPVMAYHRAATAGTWDKNTITAIPNDFYDSDTGLTPVLDGKYLRHSLYVMGSDNSKYMMVYAQVQYDTEIEAEQGIIPVAPSYFTDSIVLIASLIVQEGNSTYMSIKDERPILGFKSSGTSASASHGNLLGLESDDHPQYLLGDGSRNMGGALNMGGNSITNVNLVDGINISAHASRHLPNGADALTTGTATSLSLTSTNTEGIANAFSRADHTHAISIATASSTTTGLLSSTNWTTFNNKLGLSGGTMSGSLNMGSNTITNASSVNGVVVETHATRHLPNGADALTTAAPTTTLTLSTTNATGTANSFSRSDHTHAITIANATASVAGLLSSTDWTTFNNKLGTSGGTMTGSLNMGNNTITNATSVNGVVVETHAARHLPNGTDALATAAPTTTLTMSTTNTTGTANSFSRSDHTHAITIASANGTTTGLLSSTDWNTFNDKADSTVADDSTTGLLSSTDWTTFNNKAGTTVANGTTTGLLSSTDWNTFNNKAGSAIANTTTTGLLSSTDWNTFNNKAGSAIANTTTTGLLSSTDWNTFNNKAGTTVANGTTTGLLSSTDWNTFNNKAGTTVANGTTTGLLSSTDWTTFNSVTTHASRHLPNGTDALATAAPTTTLTMSTTNTTGTANSFSRSDHTHAITIANANGTTTGLLSSTDWTTFNSVTTHASRHLPNGTDALATAAPVAIQSTNSAGTANAFSRADHIHAHGTHTDPTNHAVATTSAHGFMSSSDKTKIESISTGATVNATDAQLRDRATHTGSQPISSITGLQTALDSPNVYKPKVTSYSGSFVTPNVSVADVAIITLTNGANTQVNMPIFNTPDVAGEGRKIILKVRQPAVGTGTISFDSSFTFPGGTAPTMTATAAKTDIFGYMFDQASNKWQLIAMTKNL
jgi:hypothetical protein